MAPATSLYSAWPPSACTMLATVTTSYCLAASVTPWAFSSSWVDLTSLVRISLAVEPSGKRYSPGARNPSRFFALDVSPNCLGESLRALSCASESPEPSEMACSDSSMRRPALRAKYMTFACPSLRSTETASEFFISCLNSYSPGFSVPPDAVRAAMKVSELATTFASSSLAATDSGPSPGTTDTLTCPVPGPG